MAAAVEATPLPRLSPSPSSDFSPESYDQARKPRLKKMVGDKSTWASGEGDLPPPLDPRYVEVKKRLVRPENYEAVTASWFRLLDALEKEVEVIEAAGSDYIPTVDFNTISPTTGTFPPEIANLIKQRGCVAIRNVVPPSQALTWKHTLQTYLTHHPDIQGFPPSHPQIWSAFWTPPQIEARTHPSMLAAQTAMSKLYTLPTPTTTTTTTNTPIVEIDLENQALYADRFRIRPPGTTYTLLPPHLDNGSIERWEDPLYSQVFTPIWEGNWESYDPWDMTYRADATIDLHGGPGSCSAFRSLQGWLSLSNNGPGRGTLQLIPSLRLTTAYLLLRPFFTPSNTLDVTSSYFHGASPGQGQILTETWHPHLQLPRTMLSVPEAPPGTYVFWHCDMVHQVEDIHAGNEDSSVMYLPVVPLCRYNIGNLVEQRKAFLEGGNPPDMPAAARGVVLAEGGRDGRDGQIVEEGGKVMEEGGQGGRRQDGQRVVDQQDEQLLVVEGKHADRGTSAHILSEQGRRLFGLVGFEIGDGGNGITEGQRRIRRAANEALGF
ncbi:MAG: hypothetical protein M1834_004464 [Cirrosporium novae-zelandiae]|nr:MAG: hypothetical protein M1834_004464 [Cirrosporium novae-zelandiae]